MPEKENRDLTHRKKNIRFAKRHGVVLVNLNETEAKIAYCKPPSSDALLELRRSLQRPLKMTPVTEDQFEECLTQAYSENSDDSEQMAEDLREELDISQLVAELPKTEDLLDSEDDAPIIRMLNVLLNEAIKRNASDIHFETFEEQLLVRFRVDGILQEFLKLDRVIAPLIISRIKVMARLNIAEKRLPQDGRFTLKIAGRPIDLRVSTIPSAFSERAVIRLLDKKAAHLDLTDLGMEQKTLDVVTQMIKKPHGIILVTGPTGSGKTTTLYATLTQLNFPSRNIMTVEDPIEYFLAGISQTQVNPKVEMTFAKGLRSILRQDPDVIMVGEVRDLETAEMAVQASLTGHLVLSTLHTNTAIGAITRLRDIGIAPYLLATTITGVVAQRLLRLLCPHCKRARSASESERQLLHCSDGKLPSIYEPVGCEQCNQQGYSGRVGIYEIISIDDTLRQMIHDDASEQKMEEYIRKSTPSIRQNGYTKLMAGDTTLEEILRVTSEH